MQKLFTEESPKQSQPQTVPERHSHVWHSYNSVELIVGVEAYSRYGNFLKTSTVPLTRSNVFARVATFWRVMQMKGEEMPTGVYVMRQIILKMIHSRRYSPGPDWLTPQIGKGLHERFQP